MEDEMRNQATALAQRLRDEGRPEHASRLVAAARAVERGAETAVFATLLGVVDVVLNTAETFDPRTQAMAEELRTMVEARIPRPRKA